LIQHRCLRNTARMPPPRALHNPDVVDLPVWGQYQGWILAGHTHGGQCKPPFPASTRTAVRNKRYTSGEIACLGAVAIVHQSRRGTSPSGPLQCASEVTIFRLQRAKSFATWHVIVATFYRAAKHARLTDMGNMASDARRTAREITPGTTFQPQEEEADKSLRKLSSATRVHVVMRLQRPDRGTALQVVAKIVTAIAIVSDDSLAVKPVISHIHFDGPYFWINIGNGQLRDFLNYSGHRRSP